LNTRAGLKVSALRRTQRPDQHGTHVIGQGASGTAAVDAEAVDDLFPTASYQYILYGMGFETEIQPSTSYERNQRRASELFHKNAARATQLRQAMPGNRDLLNKVREHGLQKL